LDEFWGLERTQLRWVAMKWGLEMREHHVLETHLNLMTDFTGSRERISTITSFGRLFDIVLLFPGIEENDEEQVLSKFFVYLACQGKNPLPIFIRNSK